MKSGGHPKRRVYESKETQNNEASKGKKQKRGKSNTDYSTLVDSSHNPKADKPDNMGVKYKSIDGMKASVEEKRDEMMNSVLKRKTRSETFKERSSAKNVLEVLKDPQNETNGTYMKFSNEEDSENWRNEDAKKETATPHKYNKPKVKGMKQGCFLNTNANTEVELEVLNIKEIKQLVTKIVKEVAAEKARNQVLKGTAAEDISGYAWDNSKKEISLDENHLKQCSSGEVKELSSVKERGSDNEKTDGADENNEGSVNEKNERADDNSTKQSLSNVADQTNCRTRRANTVNHRPLTRAKSLTSMKMVEDGNSQANESKAEVKTRLRDERREQMESLVPAPVTIIDENSQSNAAKEELKTSLRDERREQMESPVTTKCPIPEEYGDLSLRRMKVMQSLGLIAPSGSPFSKNGSIKSLASSANLS
ncbi:hypothetical protein AXF42_Ash020588 [Apostasia shenzhenica]|uniref:Uncharacterized protein n=1 Tax=Apostasia shenzhenica TaxID=1088818 RepID=A0A2I0B609_9ASPA|nr:hypothetical protein AXF42_Ash020588 [Apostasia shenzhenica]